MSRRNLYDGSCLAFAALAVGRVGASIYGPNLDFYDFCPLVPVVREAGGMITDWRGRPLDRDSQGPSIASCRPALHAGVLEVLNSASRE